MEIILRNIMEDIVIRKVDELLPKLNCCQCDRCRLDIATFTLNRLPSKYVVTTQGELLSKIEQLDTQFEATVTSQIVSASMVIAKNPRHKTKKDS